MTMLLMAVFSSVWAEEVTYTFNSKSWGATPDNWSSGKDGGIYNGYLQITTGYSGAYATSPQSFENISKIVVMYSTNSKKGKGNIVLNVGNNQAKSFTVSTSGGGTARPATFEYTPTESGTVKITVNCTENSIYIHSITITYNSASYTVSATSNDTSYGTVSVTGNVITATPAEGYQVSTTNPYTVTSGEATVAHEGNTFTVTATDDCSVQINFEAIPVVTYLYIKASNAPWIYTYNGSNKYSGDWHGTQATEKEKVTEKGFTWYKMAVSSDDFYLILNDGGSNQYPQSDGFHITGDTYLVYNSSEDGTSATYAKIVDFAEVSATDIQLNKGETGNSTITATPTGLTYTYKSSNTGVATVAADGTVTAIGGGSSTITVSWATQEVGGKHYMSGSTTFNVTVTESSTEERTYVKVTSTEDIENGKKYLIVYEDGNLAFDGSLETLDATNNYKGVTISDNTIKTAENIYFTIDNGTILSASGKYIGKNASGNGLDTNTSPITNTISISDGNAIITGTGGSSLKFNKNSDQMRFRYFGSGQQAIQLYKEGSVSEEVKIYVKADSAPYIYTWTGDGESATKYTGEYPGKKATEKTEVNGVEWYVMTVPAKGFNLILDNGYSGESNQTANINNITEDTYFVWNSETDGYAGANQYLKVLFAEVTAQEQNLKVGNTGNSVSKTPDGLVLTCTSGNESVATIAADGTVTAVAEGTATMTVNWATQVVDGQGYLGGSITFNVTVKPKSGSDVFVKAMSEDELAEGMQVIIVNDDSFVAMGEQKTNNFGSTSVDIDKDASPWEITLADEHAATILTLEEGLSGTWYFKDENGKYLYAASSGSNELKTQANADDNAKATITISGSNNDAAIVFQGTNTRNTIRYNSGNNGIFSCYASGQNPVQIYHRAAQTLIARPTITPAEGTFTEAQTVTITNNAEGATVYYTTDGTTPTAQSKAYTEPFVLNQNGTHTIKAIAISDAGKSSVATATITINIHVDAPTISPANGTQITEATEISITATAGTIYYTTDGTDPVKNGALTSSAKAYSAPFTMTKAGTVKAVAMNSDGVFSDITSASYTYNGIVTLPYYERFSADLGNFTTISTGDLQWDFALRNTDAFIERYGEARSYAFCKRNNSSAVLGQARLISPIIDLTEEGLTNVVLNFIHAGKGFTDLTNTCKVQIITDENNVITDNSVLNNPDNWTNINIPASSWFDYSGDSFPRKNSGDIDLSGFIGHKVRICFLYDGTVSSRLGNWNVDQISVRGELVEKVNIAQPSGATGEGYTTYVTKNDIDVAKTYTEKGVKLYKVIEFDANSVVIVQLGLGTTYSETMIPAETPVLVKGQFGENDLIIATSEDIIPKPKGNLLVSALDGVTATANDRFFVLQYPKSVGAYGFHLLGKGRTLSGRKAYLNGQDEVETLTTETNAKQGVFVFGEEYDVEVETTPTAIETLLRTNALPEDIYDLTGRKVSGQQLPKGIYVVKGKKFVVK